MGLAITCSREQLVKLTGQDNDPGLDSQADTLSLTVVPEPETYAAVAGAGLVAFGLFRRRAAKV